jgi:hypothetical protein
MNSPDRFVAFTSAIKNICANDSVISSDIIAKRNYCNMITLNIGAKNAAYIQMARLRMSDKIAALSTSKDPGKIALPPYGNVDSWDQAGLAMKDDFVKDLNEIDKFYKNTLIVPTAGLPEKLLNQLNGKNNPLECFESTPSGVKGLMEWHTMNTLENKGKYIVTNCYQDKNHVNQVKSRYYYEEPAKDGSTNGGNGDDVINVLGTLVGKNVGKRVAVSTIKDDPSTLSTWWGAIKISQLKDVKIGGDPYKVYGSTSWDQSSFIYEANQVGGYTISNDNYNNDGRRELRSLWVAHYWDSNVHKPADIQLWQDRDRVNTYYLLNKQSNDELIYNLWIPYSLDGNKVLRGQKNISLSTSTTVPLGLPVTLKDGTTQWVIFGLYHYNAINSNIPDYLTGEDMGVQCLSSRCNYWFDNDNQMSRINMLLDDGRKIMISFKWNNGHQGKTPTLYVDTEK